jgi:mRNA interferase RelE/StbE
VDGIKSLDKYKIAETENYFKKVNSGKYNHLYQKIFEDVYPLLKNNPFFGGNIKKLKGEYREIYRFRIGNYRLFYKVDEKKSIIFIIDIEKRQDAYK